MVTLVMHLVLRLVVVLGSSKEYRKRSMIGGGVELQTGEQIENEDMQSKRKKT